MLTDAPKMTSQNCLHIFTVNFPLGDGEPFLYDELLHLQHKFTKIYLLPMYDLNKETRYKLPDNVEVVKFEMFKPYNRLKIVFTHIVFISSLFLTEVVKSADRWSYFKQFKMTLNDLTHKIATANSLNKYLRARNQTVTIAYTYWFNQWTFTLALLRSKRNFKLFTRIHGSDVYEEQHAESGFFFKFRTFQLSRLNKVFAISENGKKHLAKMNSTVDESKIIVSRLGVRDNGIGKIESKPIYRIVSCSGLQPYKRIHLIVEILKRITEPIEWVHFGDGELKDEFLEQAKQLPGNIILKWKGFQVNSLIMDFYRSHEVDLFINVSETEGIPVSIMEAISFGIPVMATDVGGVSEIVNPKTGYLIPKQFNVNEAAEKVSKHLLLRVDQKQELRNNARLFWLDHYNANRNYENFYKEMIHA